MRRQGDCICILSSLAISNPEEEEKILRNVDWRKGWNEIPIKVYYLEIVFHYPVLSVHQFPLNLLEVEHLLLSHKSVSIWLVSMSNVKLIPIPESICYPLKARCVVFLSLFEAETKREEGRHWQPRWPPECGSCRGFVLSHKERMAVNPSTTNPKMLSFLEEGKPLVDTIHLSSTQVMSSTSNGQ